MNSTQLTPAGAFWITYLVFLVAVAASLFTSFWA